MTLKEWRESRRYTQVQLANMLSKGLNQKVKQPQINQWEGGAMPRADIGELITKLSKGKVRWIKK